MNHPKQAKTIAELQLLSDAELIAQHDTLSQGSNVGIRYYLDELARRRVDRQSRLMLRLTWLIAALTVVNVIAVIANLVS